MPDISVLQRLIDDGATSRVLKQGSDAKTPISVLQEVLFHLGFGTALDWDKSGPDGQFDAGTAKALQDFAERNGVTFDGSFVPVKLARILVQRYGFLDELHHMQDAANSPSLMAQLRFKSSNKVAVTVLQEILHQLGYDKELNWEKFGADGEYGASTAAAVKAFADKHGIASDGMKVTKEMAEACLAELVPHYGPDWYQESPKIVRQSLKVTVTSKHATVSDGVMTKKFRKFRRGYYTFGDVKTAKFIDENRDHLKSQGMTDSALNVMLGVSENEGNIDAINTWDNAIMTFGLFQWTVGVGSAKGELPALIKKIREADEDVFQEYYGAYGLGLWDKTTDTHGHFTLNGQILNTAAEKAQFREPTWCFRFWRAGHDKLVQAVSVQHAFSRIGTFARASGYRVNGHDVADVVTSEYGMALVVDNHVNRPAYIAPCLSRAMDRAGLTGKPPKDWTTADERKLIQRYLTIRETYGRSPMTDARKRAQVTKRYLTKGIISDARGSFKYK